MNPPSRNPTPPNRPSPPKPVDLEIKDAHLIFETVWSQLERKHGRAHLTFPKEIFWLNGAPGAGKGTQTRFIMEFCGLTAPPVVVSDLLDSPEARRLKDAGLMVGDREVTSLLLERLLDPERRSGVVVDGFPRTKVQVECLKLFHNRLTELRKEFRDSPEGARFPKPIFHIIVLYVDEATSVQRQLERGRTALRARGEAGPAEGILPEVRKTDLSEETARNRYRTFKEITYESLTSLREVFHYHFVNAQDSIVKVQERIVEELKYQSSLELDEATYDQLASIPVASRIVLHARQELVKRLDEYAAHHLALFRKVVHLIEQKFLPIIRRHAISGLALINSEDPVFEDPLALAMLIDVFSERGFHAVVDIRKQEIPESVDPQTWRISCRTKRVYRFRISFSGSVIRRGR